MAQETRVVFHRDLQEIDEKVIQLFALVKESIAAATQALLTGDRDAARHLADRDAVIDDLYTDIEGLVQRQFALQSPMAKDLRFLLSVLRIVPELERSGDLAEHIARRAELGHTGALTPRVRGLIEQMGAIGVEMWGAAAAAYANRDSEAAAHLNEQDDELDELHVSITAELVSGSLSVPVAIEMTLVARFFERLGDHAVNISERIRFIAEGD